MRHVFTAKLRQHPEQATRLHRDQLQLGDITSQRKFSKRAKVEDWICDELTGTVKRGQTAAIRMNYFRPRGYQFGGLVGVGIFSQAESIHWKKVNEM